MEKDDVRRLKQEGHPSYQIVPPWIFDRVDAFYCCKQTTCRAVFWEGPKFARCCEIYQHLYERDGEDGAPARRLLDINHDNHT